MKTCMRSLADFALTTLTLPRALALSVCHGLQSGSGSIFSEAPASTSPANSASCLAGTTQLSRVSCHFTKARVCRPNGQRCPQWRR